MTGTAIMELQYCLLTLCFNFVCLFAEPCCALKYYPEIEICVKEQKGEKEAKLKEAQRLEDESFGDNCIGKTRTFFWNLMEYPETSRNAQVQLLSCVCVLFKSSFYHLCK